MLCQVFSRRGPVVDRVIPLTDLCRVCIIPQVSLSVISLYLLGMTPPGFHLLFSLWCPDHLTYASLIYASMPRLIPLIPQMSCLLFFTFVNKVLLASQTMLSSLFFTGYEPAFVYINVWRYFKNNHYKAEAKEEHTHRGWLHDHVIDYSRKGQIWGAGNKTI